MTVRIPTSDESGSTITEDKVTIDDVPEGWYGSPQHQALMAWCQDHGLNTRMMPMPCTIVRDVPNCRVSTEYAEQDERGNDIPDVGGPDAYAPKRVPVTIDLDHPPAPWPAELLHG